MTADQTFADRLNQRLRAANLAELDPELCDKFEAYLALLVRWNARMNLTAVRSEDGIISRHFVESVQCARLVPLGVKTLLDFGSGGGFPGIPIALCRGEIDVTLAESQNKKAAFLQEAIRALGLKGKVYAGRGEKMTQFFDAVVMRAVDRMEDAVRLAKGLVTPGGHLLLMTTWDAFPRLQKAAGQDFAWIGAETAGSNEGRVVTIARNAAAPQHESGAFGE